jgi:uroporphyrinogen decarboxylase
VADDHFAFVLHNCAAKLPHLPAILEAGAKVFHFGAPMDLPVALDRVPKDVVLCGNLDPAGVFCQSTPEEVRKRTGDLLHATRGFPNFIISSGCDVPAAAPFDNLVAFYEAVAAQA